MGRKCYVTDCNGNCDKQNEESTFRLPSDPEEKKRWLQAIPRDPPSEFFCVKSSLVPTPAPLPRATRATIISY